MADTDVLVDYIRAAVKTDRPLIEQYLSGEFTKIQASIRLLNATMTTLETALMNGRALAERSTTTGSGTNYEFLALATDEAMLVLEGISSTGASALELHYSAGSGYVSAGTITTLAAAADLLRGVLHFRGLRSGRMLMTGSTGIVAFPFPGTGTVAVANPGTPITALRLHWAVGTIDAGTVRLMTPGAL